MMDKIDDMVQVKNKIAQSSYGHRVSKGVAISILHGKLGMIKISATWVPGLLPAENKRNCVVDFKVLLVCMRRNLDEFLRGFVTIDETWIHRTPAK